MGWKLKGIIKLFIMMQEITSIEEEERHEVLREEVRSMLVEAPSKSLEKLNLMNDIQRLGISYHFEDEIDISLKKMYYEYDECVVEDGNDLHRAALRFRLLRQQGHLVYSDVFKKFTDKSGRFNESLVSNIDGMLSLYEAAHLSVRDEDILDEALKFTSNKLELMIPKMTKKLAAQVVGALEMPIRLTLTRPGACDYISFYKQDNSHSETLLNFAELDFNMVQKLHQKELCEISRWWKNLDVPTNFPFARDRIIECYFWIIGVYFEPKYSLPRMFLTKIISLTSIMDDIYDIYGTVDELQLLTDAIQRWDISATSDLPPGSIRLYYTSMLETFKVMEEKIIKEGAPYSILYAKNEMKKLALAYLQEAIWCKEGYVPHFEEYMKVAIVTGAYMMLGTSSFVGMVDIATEQAFEWVTNEPLIITAASTISRLQDDTVPHEHEQKEHVATGIECYMKQYGVTKEEASEEFKKRISNAWKDVNAEFLHPTDVASPLLLRILNLARVINRFYKDKDNYSNSKTKMRNWISMVLVNPV